MSIFLLATMAIKKKIVTHSVGKILQQYSSCQICIASNFQWGGDEEKILVLETFESKNSNKNGPSVVISILWDTLSRQERDLWYAWAVGKSNLYHIAYAIPNIKWVMKNTLITFKSFVQGTAIAQNFCIEYWNKS